MDVWWLALDTECTSYLEVKRRQVIAQGWPQLGDLYELVRLAGAPDNRAEFDERLDRLAAATYGSGATPYIRCRKMLWRFLSVRPGDLFVGIEGTTVKGICRLERTVRETYKFDDFRQFPYAQTYGSPVDWVDWNREHMGPAPIAPAQSVLAIAGLRAHREHVITAWNRFQE